MKVSAFTQYTLIFSSLLLGGSTCSPLPRTMDLSNTPVVAILEKGPCYGRCPVFTLTLYDNNIAIYEGKRFTDKEGTWMRKLDKGEIASLREKFRVADFFNLPRVYPSRIPDMATVTITYHEEGRSWTVMGKEGRPEAVLGLEQDLDNIANTGSWVVQAGSSAEVAPNNEIIVQLHPETQVPVWLEKYVAFEVDAVKKLTPQANNWLIVFNASKISAEELLRQLQTDPDVLGAQINLPLEPR
jgi:hypothetical protein